MNRLGFVLAAGALAAGALLAACGGDDAPPTPTSTATPTPTVATPTPTEGASAPSTPSPTATASPATATPTPTATATPTAASTEDSTSGGESRPAPIAAFTLPSITIERGTTVVWQNADGVPHTATAEDGSFDSGSLEGSTTFSHTFEEAGTFDYFCAVHPSMTGTITVN